MNEPKLAANPLFQFQEWLADAIAHSGLDFPNAMSLATADGEGRPSVRMVLLKGLSSEGGFQFFTNYESRKANDLSANPFAALCFYWEKIHRSVRVEGKVEKLSAEESQEYFDTRARESRIGAWASPQSRELAGRAELEEKFKEMEQRFREQEKIPVPPHWGGYRLIPARIEFWTNGAHRLHDRFVYEADGNGGWTVKRLAP